MLPQAKLLHEPRGSAVRDRNPEDQEATLERPSWIGRNGVQEKGISFLYEWMVAARAGQAG